MIRPFEHQLGMGFSLVGGYVQDYIHSIKKSTPRFP